LKGDSFNVFHILLRSNMVLESILSIMQDVDVHQYDEEKVRVTITLREPVYTEIKKISHEMGIRPSTWMAMICTSKAGNIELNHFMN